MQTYEKETINFNGLKDSEQVALSLLVKKGFTHGVVGHLSWKLESEKKELDSEQIGEAIYEGYTSGFHPTWSLAFQRKSIVEEEEGKTVFLTIGVPNVSLLQTIGVNPIYHWSGKYYIGLGTTFLEGVEVENAIMFFSLEKAIQIAKNINDL